MASFPNFGGFQAAQAGGARESYTANIGERVRVTVRVRPLNRGDDDNGPAADGGCIDVDNNKKVIVHRRGGAIYVSEFEFDQVLPPGSTQAEVYSCAAQPVIEDVLNGYNGTIMAYGATGAGKTYTLSSIDPESVGIIPRAAAEVFVQAAGDPDHKYTVYMSFIQIYMEQINDLLRPESDNIQIREDSNGVFVSGVQEVEVRRMEDCLRLLQLGERNRTVAFTRLNASSSRSHAIVMLTVEKRRRADLLDAMRRRSGGQAAPQVSVLVGKLFLVDLAGSERLKKSGSEGVRASEARSINLSLTVLGKCISARADPTATHVPFRDSKLTRLLQESLGGNAKTSLIINCYSKESFVDETINSLHFGARAMRVKTRAVVNEEMERPPPLEDTVLSPFDADLDQRRLMDSVLGAKNEELDAVMITLEQERLRQEHATAELRAGRAAMDAEREAWEAERVQYARDMHALEARWRQRLQITEAVGQRRLEEAEIRAEGRAASALEGERVAVAALEAARQKHGEEAGELRRERDALRAKVEQLLRAVTTLRSTHQDFQVAMEGEQGRHLAAGTIQRAVRKRKLRQLVHAAASAACALAEREDKYEQLALQNAALASGTGRNLVADTVGMIHQATSMSVAKFLLPKKKWERVSKAIAAVRKGGGRS
mmetsp:Transcript_34853/g.110066  ORF Transcript_34853/g.110066 Transcript_34853/m.110066 type:complete len:658 (+) Transcript_34853:1122-3095(+)